ncbi:GNAT family N-acetyltransferase [Vibrio sp. CAU 1672]|uniref:GNAT family N-acetyltransferase n=1 Tax=Vibrio sp. CAU 1672 TaxID=3032594 RepID=UPI0023DC8ED9|nr:GNAT family N-acetyltransferase [Vibrio sp. CAU 1672]MDF2155549.1 GNAT family N-acetyltransferase [Vibrio sp. CAU 1672]
MLLLPYSESLQLEFVMLNCCAINRAQMNGPHNVASAKQLFNKILDDDSVYSMAVLDNSSRDYMGHVFISHLDDQAELGFIFDKTYWGRGLATEALKAFFPKACRELGLERVRANVNVNHQAAIAVLEKLGFSKSKEYKDLYGPYYELEFTSGAVVGESSAA